MLRKVILLLIFISFLPSHVTAQELEEDARVKRYQDVWSQNCKSCHTSEKHLIPKVKGKTRADLVQFLKSNDENHKFAKQLSDEEIEFLAVLVMIHYRLNNLRNRTDELKDALKDSNAVPQIGP